MVSRRTLEFEKQSTELIAVEERIEQLEEDKEFLKEELSVAISELPDNYITAKRNLREQYNPQIVRVNEEILDYKKTRADLEIQLVSTGVDVGPAIYLARTFGTDIDTVVKLFIFILIFVFDPLELCYNIQTMLLERKPKEKTQDEHWKDIYSQPTFTDEEDFSVERND